MMYRLFKIVRMMLLLAFLTGCVNSVDSLVGEYALEEGGKPQFKVEKEGDNYSVSAYEGGHWNKQSEHAVKCGEKEYAEVFGPQWRDIQPVGLQCGIFGVFKVKKGATLGDHTFKTGYFLLFIMGGDVYKI